MVDNAPTFHGSKFASCMEKYKIETQFRAAYRPSTNGIVERNHRTIKCSAARGRQNVYEALYWYNSVMKKNGKVPCAEKLKACKWRKPWLEKMSKSKTEIKSIWKPGDHVYVKPSNRYFADIRCRFISNENGIQSPSEEFKSQNFRRTYAS